LEGRQTQIVHRTGQQLSRFALGARFTRIVGADCFCLRVRTVPLRNLGASLSPDSAWIFLQGAETLPLRIVRHSENALAVANH